VAAYYTGTAAIRLHAIGASTTLVVVYACVAAVFGFAGFGLIAVAVSGRKPTLEDPDLRTAHPDQPWLWRQEWVNRRVGDQAAAGTLLLWGFTLLWNAIASPVLLFLPAEIRKGNVLAWAGLLFPLVGAVLIVNAVRLTIRVLRFRASTLLLDTVPVPIGGTLRGTVEVPHPLTSVTAVMIRLVALERRESGRSTTDTIACHEERELDPSLLRRTADGVVIPIEIAVPADAPPTESTDGPRQVFWRLNVDAEVPGVDYSAKFDVPVFRTAFSDFRPHGTLAAVSAPLDPHSYVERQLPEGRELYFPRFNAPSRAFLSLLFAFAWIGAIAFMTAAGAPRILPIVFGLIAIPIVLSTLELFFESRTIIIGPHEVTLRRRLLSRTEQVIPLGEIESAKAVIGAQSGSARPFYRVDIETTAGKRVKAAKNIRSKREAEWVASRIKPVQRL
jgi:hypothetical protein